MRIIDSWEHYESQSCNPVDPKQIELDRPKLLEEHQKAMKSDPMWPFFGGIITIERRQYQVMASTNEFAA